MVLGWYWPKQKSGYTKILSSCDTHQTMSQEILITIGQNPSVSKSNQLHVKIFQFFFVDWGIFYRFF